MKQLSFLSILSLFLPLSLCAQNDNANTADVEYATRMEIPHLKSGEKQLFIVHEVPDYGVNYCLEWDCSTKAQRWGAYEWYKSNSVENWKRNDWKNTDWGGDPFQEDTAIPAQYRSTYDMHKANGYDRGHIVASADRLNSQDANEQTFYYSNMQPQVHNFNAGVWESMEEQLREWNNDSFRDTLFVVKGGTIDRAQQIIETTSAGLLVPKYFFMGVLCKKDGRYKALGFWAEHKENTDTSLGKYAVSIDQIEKMTGLDLFCNLPDDIEKSVEAAVDKTAWGYTDDGEENPDLDNTDYGTDTPDTPDDPDDNDNLFVTSITDGGQYIIATQPSADSDWVIASVMAENKTSGTVPTVTTQDEMDIPQSDKSTYYIFNKVKEGVYTMTDSYGRYLYPSGSNSVSVSSTCPTDGSANWNVSFDDDGSVRIINVSTSKYFRYSSSYYKGYITAKSAGVLPHLYKPTSATSIPVMEETTDKDIIVYTTDGRRVSNDTKTLPAGIYVMKTNNQTRKIIIK